MSFAEHSTLRRAVFVVALLNLAYFGVEFAVALAIGSVSLFADSVDFLEDASINLLIFIALSWSVPRRAVLGMVLAGILLIPGLATLWTAWDKFWLPLPPAPVALTLAGTGALAVNLTCAVILARYRGHAGSLTRAAFLSARNDAFANIAIIAAGLRNRRDALGLARPRGRARHSGNQRRRSARGLCRRAAGAPRRGRGSRPVTAWARSGAEARPPSPCYERAINLAA